MMEFGRNALILMYHRVADLGSDPWGLAVGPKHFGEQLEILRKHSCPVRLQDLSQAIRNGGVPRQSVVLTFDDGYADNLYNARPVLDRYDIPATVFVTSGYLDQRRELWWDELERVLLQPGTLPDTLRLTINGQSHQWELGGGTRYGDDAFSQYRDWRAWDDAWKDAPTPRHHVYSSLWRLLQPLPELMQRSLLDELSAWAGRSEVRDDYRTVSPPELLDLARGGLVEIGAHTVTHPVLSGLPVDQQRSEVQQCKFQLEEVLGRPVTSFAYPYGALSDVSARVVEEAGFDCACSTDAAPVESNGDLFRLPRIQVNDWDGEEFGRRLGLWLQTPRNGLFWTALRTNKDTGQVVQAGLWLRIADGNEARIEVPRDDPDGIRIAIERAVTGEAYDIQLNYPALEVRARNRYQICFRARADQPRSVFVGFSQAHEPWAGLGLYKRIELIPEWQSFREEFLASASDGIPRIHFDVGGSEISVDVSGIGIFNASDPT